MQHQKQLAPNYKWVHSKMFNTVEKEIKDIIIEIDGIKIDINNINTSIENLENVDLSLQTQISNLSTTVSNNNNYVLNELSSVDSRLNDIDVEISDIKSELTQIDTRISQNETNINNLSSRIDNIIQEIPLLKWLINVEIILPYFDGSTDFTFNYEIPYNFTNVFCISSKMTNTTSPISMFADIEKCGISYNFIRVDNKDYVQVKYTAVENIEGINGNLCALTLLLTQLL